MLTPYKNNRSEIDRISRNKRNFGSLERFRDSPIGDFGFGGEIFHEIQDFSNKIMKRMDHEFSNAFKAFGGFGNIDRIFDDFDFSQPKGNGTVISKSYISSFGQNPSGQKYEQKYFANNVDHYEKGNVIGERVQGYKNSLTGESKIAQERRLNNKGRKVVKSQTQQGNNLLNHYYNLEERDAQNFDRDWMRVNEETNFWNRNASHLGFNPMGRQIGNGYERNPYRHSTMRETARNNLMELGAPQPSINEERRGHFIPQHLRDSNQPVQNVVRNEPLRRGVGIQRANNIRGNVGGRGAMPKAG